MEAVPNIPVVPLPKPPVDPVQRSIAKPDAFAKPAAFKAKPSPKANQRVRTMDWKRTRGRPRKRPFDPRKIHFF